MKHKMEIYFKGTIESGKTLFLKNVSNYLNSLPILSDVKLLRIITNYKKHMITITWQDKI